MFQVCARSASQDFWGLMWNPKKVLTGTVVRFDFSIFSGVAIQKVAQVDALGFTLGKFPSFIPQTSCNKWIDWMLLGSFGFTSGAFFSYSPILLIMVISLFLILLIMGGMLVIDEPLILCWYSFLLFMRIYYMIPHDYRICWGSKNSDAHDGYIPNNDDVLIGNCRA